MHAITEIRETVSRVARDYDIDKVYLFGSYARGEADSASDIDLCLETGPTFSLFNAGDLARRLERTFDSSVDMVTERSLYDFVRAGCLQDRVLIYERV